MAAIAPHITQQDLAAALQGTSFAWTVDAPRPRVIISVDGDEKTGKTHFALGAPGPICYQNIDKGEEGVIEKFNLTKPIGVADYEFKVPSAIDREDAVATTSALKTEWERFIRDYRAALAAKARTLVIDTASEMWEMMRLARLGKLTQVMPHQYTAVNNEFREMIRLAYNSDSNLILLHKTKDEWVDNNKTGARKRQGMSEVGFLVQAVVRTRYVKPKTRPTPNGGLEVIEPGHRWLDIVESRTAPELSGSSFENMNFQQLAMMLHPNVAPNVWF